MNPGRELDRLVAEKVMGKKLGTRKADPLTFPLKPGSIFHDVVIEPEPYSTDIAAAWEVVEKTDMLSAHFLQKNMQGQWGIWDEDGQVFFGETAPHAICLAALKALGKEG